MKARSISKFTNSNIPTFFTNNSKKYNISFQQRNLEQFQKNYFVLSFFELVTGTIELVFSKCNFLFFNFELVAQSENFII